MTNPNEKPNILVVDDVPANIRILAELLGDNYEISAATNGPDALRTAVNFLPNLILLDIVMPEMDGFEVIRRLHANEATRSIPVIFVTAKISMDDEVQGLALGAVDFITKPFNPSVIRARVRNHLALRQAMDSLHAISTRNELILQTVEEGIFYLNKEEKIIYINASGRQMLGWQPEELYGKSIYAIFRNCCKDDTCKHNDECHLHKVFNLNKTFRSLDDRFWRKDETWFPVEFVLSPVMKNENNMGGIVVFRDITHKKELEEQEYRNLSFRLALNALHETSFEPLSLHQQLDVALEIILNIPRLSLSHKGSILLVDQESGELVIAAHKNFTQAQINRCNRVKLGQCLCGLAAKNGETLFVNHVDERHTITYEGMANHGHYCVPISSGKVVLGVLNLYVEENYLQNQEYSGYLPLFCQALTKIIRHRNLEAQLMEAKKHLEHAANHDRLTGLPNRRLLYELFDQYATVAKRNKQQLAVMFIDLDKFKPVNDTYGHEAGDLLLQSVAKRLKKLLRDSDIVARIGGDEFIILIQGITNQDGFLVVAEKIVQEIRNPFHMVGISCQIGCSIGISIFPDHGENLDVLLGKADRTLYTVKEQGRNNFLVWNDA